VLDRARSECPRQALKCSRPQSPARWCAHTPT
jgi:hypothetical protein